MHALDWIFIAFPLLLVFGIGVYAQRHMKSVADFMSGGRVAGRYLLAVASGEMQAGAVVFVATFEQIAKSGFTLTWWRWIPVPVILLFAISGFVGFRFRETRAMTWSQFFEIRYSRKFRIFTGLLGFVAGIFNFGIIPAVGSRFFVYYLGMPEAIPLFGLMVPTYVLVMAVLLSITLTLALAGGMITVMVTDCMEGIISQLFYIVIIAALLIMFTWSDIASVLANAPPGQSRLNPFDSLGLRDFNLWYVLMGMFLSVYGWGAWQNASAYKSAPLNPHEGRMSGVLSQWRELGKLSVVTLLAICAVTFLQHPNYAAQAQPALAAIDGISSAQIQQQMSAPIALSYLLPVGVKGMLCAILLLGVFGGDCTHLHSWGGIFVQDVLLPLRKKPFTPKQHIRALRLGILAVAIFAFLFGALVKQTEYIFMWWAVTQAIYVGGAGAAILGGLYWKKGTTVAAWSALLVGSTLAVGGIVARQIVGTEFPLNGVQISFGASLIAIAIYIGLSLLTCREDFNMDRMLHRGVYAQVAKLVGDRPVVAPAVNRRISMSKLIGFDENFTKGDKLIAGGLFGWSMLCIGVLVVGSIWNLVAPWSVSVWSSFWHVVGIGIPVLFTIVTGIWFTWGGLRDIASLFRRLKLATVNIYDDGTVVNHQNLDEEILVEKGIIAVEPPKHSDA